MELMPRSFLAHTQMILWIIYDCIVHPLKGKPSLLNGMMNRIHIFAFETISIQFIKSMHACAWMVNPVLLPLHCHLSGLSFLPFTWTVWRDEVYRESSSVRQIGWSDKAIELKNKLKFCKKKSAKMARSMKSLSKCACLCSENVNFGCDICIGY